MLRVPVQWSSLRTLRRAGTSPYLTIGMRSWHYATISSTQGTNPVTATATSRRSRQVAVRQISYAEAYERSIDPARREAFWAEAAEDIHWFAPYDKVSAVWRTHSNEDESSCRKLNEDECLLRHDPFYFQRDRCRWCSQRNSSARSGSFSTLFMSALQSLPVRLTSLGRHSRTGANRVWGWRDWRAIQLAMVCGRLDQHRVQLPRSPCRERYC